MSDLSVLTAPPPGLFGLPTERLTEVLSGPTLLHLPGRLDPPLFVSVLLHGNETSGWQAVCRLLAERKMLPRSLLLFIGNVAAAARGVRSLPEQMDFNRIWRGANQHDALVGQVMDRLRAQPLFAALDIHNNTGRNPHYSVLTEVSRQTAGLAYLFSEKAVLVEEPDTVLARAMQELCPATTVEVGPVNDPQSVARTVDLLERYLLLSEIPEEDPANLTLHRSVGRVHVLDGVEFDFADEAEAGRLLQDDLVLTAGMEAVNFHSVPAGTEFGFTRRPLRHALRVLDPQHNDVTDEFLEEVHGDISLRRPIIPAMYTTDHDVIRQDCLCYFMEEI